MTHLDSLDRLHARGDRLSESDATFASLLACLDRYFNALANFPLVHVRDANFIIEVISVGQRDLSLLRLVDDGPINQFLNDTSKRNSILFHEILLGGSFQTRSLYAGRALESVQKGTLPAEGSWAMENPAIRSVCLIVGLPIPDLKGLWIGRESELSNRWARGTLILWGNPE